MTNEKRIPAAADAAMPEDPLVVRKRELDAESKRLAKEIKERDAAAKTEKKLAELGTLMKALSERAKRARDALALPDRTPEERAILAMVASAGGEGEKLLRAFAAWLGKPLPEEGDLKTGDLLGNVVVPVANNNHHGYELGKPVLVTETYSRAVNAVAAGECMEGNRLLVSDCRSAGDDEIDFCLRQVLPVLPESYLRRLRARVLDKLMEADK